MYEYKYKITPELKNKNGIKISNLDITIKINFSTEINIRSKFAVDKPKEPFLASSALSLSLSLL